MAERPIWYRLREETDKAWYAFQTYRDMDAPRSFLGAYKLTLKARESIRERDPKSVPSQFQAWTVDHRWEERVKAYDDLLETKRLTEREEQIRKMEERHAGLAKLAQQKVLERIKNLKPDEISPGMIAQLLQTAIRVEREAMGQSTDRVAVDVGEQWRRLMSPTNPDGNFEAEGEDAWGRVETGQEADNDSTE